jgi:glutathione peroxidase-family protein
MSGKNKVQLIGDRLEVIVQKKTAGRKWASLEVQNLSKAEIMARRNESINRYNKEQEEIEKKAKSAKWNMEKTVIDEQMAVDKHQRKTIKHKKA